MPNEAYKNRLEEWEKKERERKAAMDLPPPYESGDMESRIPLGCALAIVAAFLFSAWLIYRYFKLQGG